MLVFENVSFSYPDGRLALDDISFRADDGCSLGIAGANGAGKSTLLYLLPAILLPSSGSIIINGKKSGKATAKDIRRDVGFIFQDSEDQLFMPTVFDDVAFGPRNMGLPENEVLAAVERALELTGISALRDRAPYRLSGGEKKLAAIAGVLAMNPKILVMDEPTASLDPRARRGLINLLPELHGSKIIASHDLDMIWETCDRVIVLKDGKIAADGNTKDILSNAVLLFDCGLEPPLMLRQI